MITRNPKGESRKAFDRSALSSVAPIILISCSECRSTSKACVPTKRLPLRFVQWDSISFKMHLFHKTRQTMKRLKFVLDPQRLLKHR